MSDQCERSSATDAAAHTYQIGPAESPTTAVVTAVAAVTNTPPTDLDSLSDVVDPEALDRLWVTESDACMQVAFDYAGQRVVVTAEEVRITRSS